MAIHFKKVTAICYGTVGFSMTSKELYMAILYNMVCYGYGQIVMGYSRSLPAYFDMLLLIEKTYRSALP